MLQQGFVLLANGLPIVPVHCWHIEPVAIATPHFIEYLIPLLCWHAINNETGGGDWFLCLWPEHRGVEKLEATGAADDDLRAVARKCKSADPITKIRLLAILDRVKTK